MDEKQARRLVREIAKTGWLRLTDHCQERMRKRNVTMDDMLQALFWGEVREIKDNPDRDNWECLICGLDLEKEPLTVKVAVVDGGLALLCITVF